MADLIQNHQILRTCFVWQGLEQPLQIVQKHSKLVWQSIDLTQQADERWQELLKTDRQQVFALNQAPLMRFSLVYLPNNEIRLIWTHSHLLLDGWSVANLLKEVLLNYAQLASKATAVQYQDYIAWLIQQNPEKSQSFWQQQLQDHQSQTLTTEASHQQGYFEEIISIPETIYQNLQNQAKQQGLTLNSFVQAAWGLLLAQQTQVDEVLFGITVSGRSVAVAQIEQMAGLFINTLPLALSIDKNLTLIELLNKIQLLQFELQQHEHIALSAIQQWINRPLVFDSIVIFENYPVDPLLSSDKLPLRITDVQAVEHTNYPLTLLAIPKKAMTLQITYNGQLFSKSHIQALLEQLNHYLTVMSEDLTQTLNQLMITDTEQQQNAEFLLASMEIDEDF